ncbi:MAG: antibiotic biosynthesis monooxygenase [Streptosporangiaceae bacterium]
MVEALVALLATLAALGGTGLLGQSALSERRPHLVAWSLSLVGLTIALAAMAFGALVGFNPALFRAMQLGGALLAPLALALGLIELISSYVQVRFATRLIGISYSLVALVILAIDPLRGTAKLGKAIPAPGDVYDALPMALIGGANVIAIITIVVGAVITAVRAKDQNQEAYEQLLPVALAIGAGVLIVGAGYVPGVVKVLSLAVAVGLIWFAGLRSLPPHQDEKAEKVPAERPRHRQPAQQNQPAQHNHQSPPAARRQPPVPVPVPADPEPYEFGYEESPFPAPYLDDGPFTAPTPAPRIQEPDLQHQQHGMMRQGAPEPRYQQPAPPQLPPYGTITVYTLLDGREQLFDRLAQEVLRHTREAEPDLLIYTCHEVQGAPTQRISYQLFRDYAAFKDHQRQPHVIRFLADSRTHVLATNVIELKLTGGKVLPLPSPASPR